jgi:thiamine biosynthesis protein ThiS
MQITINGEKKTIDNNTTLAALLNELNIDAQKVAVELNRNIINKSDYSKTILKENDSLEIVSFIGGGAIG